VQRWEAEREAFRLPQVMHLHQTRLLYLLL
jgi:hypothetical protein